MDICHDPGREPHSYSSGMDANARLCIWTTGSQGWRSHQDCGPCSKGEVHSEGTHAVALVQHVNDCQADQTQRSFTEIGLPNAWKIKRATQLVQDLQVSLCSHERTPWLTITLDQSLYSAGSCFPAMQGNRGKHLKEICNMAFSQRHVS